MAKLRGMKWHAQNAPNFFYVATGKLTQQKCCRGIGRKETKV